MRNMIVAVALMVSAGAGARAGVAPEKATVPAPALAPPAATEAAARAPTAAELLDRYEKSMAALRNSRINWVIRGELAYSWKASEWLLQDLTTERDERGRMRVVWRRRAPTPDRKERLAPEDAYVSTFLWDGE